MKKNQRLEKTSEVASSEPMNIFELLIELWKGKTVVLSTVIFAICLGFASSLLLEKSYETRVGITVSSPPFAKESEVVSAFASNFYSQQTFSKWQVTRPSLALSFDDLQNFTDIDGVAFKRPRQAMTLYVKSKKGEHGIIIKSKDIKLISDTKAYVDHISEILTEKMLNSALGLIEAQANDQIAGKNDTDKFLWQLRFFVMDLKSGGTLVRIDNPSVPRLVSMSFNIWMLVFVFGGLLAGSSFVLIRQSIRKFRKALN